MKSRTTSRSRKSPVASTPRSTDPSDSAARDHYQREKARRAKRTLPETEAMAAARREYLALLEADAAKGKGGRPRKKMAAQSEAEPADELDEHEGDGEQESEKESTQEADGE